MATLRGTVERVTFHNDDNGYTVFHVLPEGGTVTVACVGTAPTIEPGLSVVLTGHTERHNRYGPRFAVESYEIVRPTTADGIMRMLSSGFIAGIGQTRARAIVERFGAATLDVLDTAPERLREVNGIGPKTLAKIRAAWDTQKHLRTLILFLQQFGVTLNMAYRIHKVYGEAAQARVSADPYGLIDDIWGIGFKKADAIARKLGYASDSYKRIQAGLRFVLEEAAAEGHCYLPVAELTDRATALLDVDRALVTYSLDHAIQARLVVGDNGNVYLSHLHAAETQVAAMLHERLTAEPRGVPADQKSVQHWFESQAARSGWQVDERQIAACLAAVRTPLFVLTGGPGTGKTTTLQLLVGWLRRQGLRVALAAPTGRAAQRMGSVAGTPAQTIHRLLEFRPERDRAVFGRNAARPLDTDVVVVDEVSMVDILLMRSLLEALPPCARLVLVGDSNQLPSIGPGNVLADLIGSGRVPHVQLTTLFRQAARSRIVTCAHEVIRGEVSRFSNAPEDNCFFQVEDDPARCLELVIDLVCSRLPKRYAFDPRTDIQVLSPMHRGELGTQSINRLLQQRLTSGGPRVTRGDTSFAIGDRVMQVRNNYDRGVFNGDIGYVTRIDDEGGVEVQFDTACAVYDPRELDELIHAYCISIHKSQGCEFRAVVIPMTTQHFVMLRRNLVYTALTRARELCVFVGSRKAFALAVRAQEGQRRYTRLAQRLQTA